MDGKEYNELVNQFQNLKRWGKDQLKLIGELIQELEFKHDVKLFNWQYDKGCFFNIPDIDFGYGYVTVIRDYSEYGTETQDIPVTWLLNPDLVTGYFKPEIDKQIKAKLVEQEKKATKAKAKEEKERKLLAELKAKYE